MSKTYKWTRKERNICLKPFTRPYLDSRHYTEFKMNKLPLWMKTYGYWLNRENNSSMPRFYRKFSRGTIVMVNFGIQLGGEFSGPHFAIVLNKNDTKYSSVLTVVPLSSKYHKNYANLGYELLGQINKLFEDFHKENIDNLKYLNTELAKLMDDNTSGQNSFQFTEEESDLLRQNGIADEFNHKTLLINAGASSPEITQVVHLMKSVSDYQSYKNIHAFISRVEPLLKRSNHLKLLMDEEKQMSISLGSLVNKASNFNAVTYANTSNITTVSKLKITKFSKGNISENTAISSESMRKIVDKLNESI
ncbi:type II toxin-antitoxin system PemK/MazF family toxin [Lactiplantibacillus plantarum]|uniref:type II toxin-antitoxin system PemK/MazF family toxin n=1 Tax=Lactiplantibacillus plantarum TaxID=1590 RepID=UPI0008636424|nr:type II toxin-antitoxin system PemK/MazF family toxin [Lactiplantibacillus plantarum]APB84629.1 hypothetical protein BL295_01825 [Lactiplantibacillus plantarum]UQK33381.1 type II toxin-antitoxin system PemK/MazF family toxin [Lactiplantibacillus plantarum]